MADCVRNARVVHAILVDPAIAAITMSITGEIERTR